MEGETQPTPPFEDARNEEIATEGSQYVQLELQAMAKLTYI
jgi:hypothetical protein